MTTPSRRKRKPPRRRSPAAKALGTTLYRQRVVPGRRPATWSRRDHEREFKEASETMDMARMRRLRHARYEAEASVQPAASVQPPTED